VEVVEAAATDIHAPLVGVPLAEGAESRGTLAALDSRLGGVIVRALASGDFRGRKDEILQLYPADASSSIERVVLVGLGKPEELGPDRLRRAVGHTVRQAERLRIVNVALVAEQAAEASRMDTTLVARVAADAAAMAAWDFRELKTDSQSAETKPVESFTLFVAQGPAGSAARQAAEQGEIIGRAANLARGLAIRPGNIATPSYLAETALALAKRLNLKVSILDRPAMEKEGMKSLLSVAQGSMEEPRFIAIEYHGGMKESRPLVLIGKGVTFDSGGISIKPAERMEEMKYDMSGAAATLGAMQGIAELRLPVNVVGLIPSTENLPSGTAVKPGDVIGTHLGKTIEVVNTDAEGRLILVDALSYARRYQPAAMLDAATLTGAVVVALGNHAIGLMGNNDTLLEEVRAAGNAVGERCWPLPLWPEYREQIDSTVADLKNTGGRAAGTITAGWFLREFAGDIPWAHLDIAGTAYRDEAAPWLRKGPTGVPTRLFIEWVRSRSTE
jgi:leucyl aminopeptidase